MGRYALQRQCLPSLSYAVRPSQTSSAEQLAYAPTCCVVNVHCRQDLEEGADEVKVSGNVEHIRK